MAQLPGQRGFYDDIRPFQRRDIKVRLEAFAPTRMQQLRVQLIAGGLMFLFLVATLVLRLYFARTEATEVPHASSPWQGVAQGAAGAPPAPATHAHH
jgi:hypothetical protein